MSSAAQIAANQKNAQLSTGPTSQAGKTQSLNAVKSGLTGRTVLLPSEDAALYEMKPTSPNSSNIMLPWATKNASWSSAWPIPNGGFSAFPLSKWAFTPSAASNSPAYSPMNRKLSAST